MTDKREPMPDLFGGGADEKSDIMDELTGVGGKRPAAKTSKRPAAKTSKRQNALPGRALTTYLEAEKVRSTIYFSEETIELLEAAQARLKRLVSKAAGKEKRNLVTKSLLAEVALQIVLGELEEKGTESQIAKWLSEL